ncbi:MAG: hypothetical protein Q7S84_01620 [bacterium]|nr:hypothetical protein [bacterium]
MKIRAKRIMLGVVTVVTLSAGVYVWRAAREPVVLPGRFSAARTDAAAASEEVVRLADEVRRLVGEINATERVGEHATALLRIVEARERNEAARQAAVTLTNRLASLAESLGDIVSSQSQRLAFEAVAAQLAVADEYLTYTANLGIFFDIVSSATADETGKDRSDSLKAAVDEVNRSATRINELNGAAGQALVALDKSL